MNQTHKHGNSRSEPKRGSDASVGLEVVVERLEWTGCERVPGCLWFLRLSTRGTSPGPARRPPSSASRPPGCGPTRWVSSCGRRKRTSVRPKLCVRTAFQAPAGSPACSAGGDAAVRPGPAEACCPPRTLAPLRPPEQRHLPVGRQNEAMNVVGRL